jgi:iron complex transport system substrate-binding protein
MTERSQQRRGARRLLALAAVFLSTFGQADDAPRVVTLAPHLTELVYAIGAEDRLVGVVEYSDFPPAARELPRIGDAFRFDYERLLTLDATLALAWRDGTPASAGAAIERLGIDVVWIETRRIDDIPAAMRAIGRHLTQTEPARRRAEAFERTLATLRRDYAMLEPELSVFYQVSSRPLHTLGGRHLINDALAVCRMRNVFADLDDAAPVVSQEAVIAADPALILAADSSPDALALWTREPMPSLLAARLETIDPDRLIRPSPRILDGIRELCELRSSKED